MTGRRSKRKGYRIEKMCVDMLNGWGAGGQCPIRAKRGDGTIGEDVYVHVGAAEFRIECKGRRTGEGFKTLLQWIVGSDALFLHADNQPSLVAIKPSALRDMLSEAYRAGELNIIRTTTVTPVSIIHYRDGTIEEVGGQPLTKSVKDVPPVTNNAEIVKREGK